MALVGFSLGSCCRPSWNDFGNCIRFLAALLSGTGEVHSGCKQAAIARGTAHLHLARVTCTPRVLPGSSVDAENRRPRSGKSSNCRMEGAPGFSAVAAAWSSDNL